MKYPILYAKDATDFFSLGLGVLTNTLEAKVTEERNGSFFLEAKVLTDTEMYKKIELDSLIKADAGVSLKDQRFRVKRVIENHDGTADIYAEHISYLTQELSLKPNVTVRGPADVAIKAWAANIIDKHPFIVDSDIRTDNSTTWEIGDVDNAREALGGVQGSMLDVWGGEYIFDNYHISLKEKRGKTANALIAYGRNITDFEQEKNIMSTYTSLFPYARYTDDDQKEHLVTLPEYLVDSEYVKNYPNRKALPVDFSSEFEGKDKPTPDKLRTLAKSYIKDNEVGIPKVSIQVSFLDLSKTLDYKEIATLEELNLCDDVRVEYPKLGVSTVSKVVKVVWDVLADRYETIEIGAKRTTLGTTIKEQNDAIKEIEKNTNDALVSSDGKNMIFYGLYGEDGLGEPTATKVGDLWYKPNGDYTIMYVWNGTVWEQVLNTEDEAIIKDELEQMDKDVQEAKDKTDEVAVGLVEVQKDADEAKASAEQSKVDASKAMQDALTALDNSKETQSSLLDLTIKVDENTSELETKASKQDLNKLDGTVKNQQTQITQNANEIKTKASQSEFNVLKGTVTNQQTQINQNSENIKLKAEKSEVTNLKEDVDSIERNNRNYFLRSDDIKQDDLKLLGNSKIGWFKKTTIEGYDFEFSSWNIDYITPGQVFGFISAKSGNYTDEVYTNSIYVKNDGKVDIYISDNVGRKETVSPGQVRRVVLTGSFNDKLARQFSFLNAGVSAYLTIARPKIEKGKIATPWSLAPEDLATQSDVTSLSASIDVQANQIKNLVTKTDGHSTQLANLTIESDRISSQVVDLQKQEIGGTNYFSKYINNYVTNGTYMYRALPIGNKIGRVSLKKKIVDKQPVYLGFTKTGEDATVKDPLWLVANGEVSKEKISTTDYDFISVYPKTQGSLDWLTEHFNIKIETGDKTTDWSLAPEDTATQSQITQLSDDILLRVQKNDVVNQINISTEGILIDGKKVHITGQTTIDNAVIKNAMIDSVSANKLTAGTIDANKINVINLNASNMTTGTLKAITISGNNSYWDLTTGLFKMNNPQNVGQNITIQNGRFQSNEGTDKEIFILGDTMTARSLTTTIALDPKKIIFRGDGYVRQLELQGQGLSISSKGQNIGGPEFYNVGLEIEADGDIAYLDFTTKGRNLDYHSRIKSVDGGTTNGSGVLQYESKRHDFVGDEVRFENIKSFSMNNATISSPAKNMILTSQTGSNSVLAIEKAGTGDNHYFNFRMRAPNHGVIEWGVSAWASDRKLKTNIKPTEIDAIGVINNLNVVQFDWKYDLAHVGVGLVAQEVEETFPQAVFENLGEIKQLKPEAFIPLLIKNIQELNKRVAELEGGV